MTRTILLCLAWLAWASAQGTPHPEPAPPASLPQLDKLVDKQTRLLPLLNLTEGPVLDLQECYRMALEQHPVLMSQRAQVDQAAAQLEVSWAAYDPSVAINVNRTFLTVSPFEFPGQPQVTQNFTQGSLNITQTITDSGKRWAQVQSSEWFLKSSFYNYHKTRLQQFQLIQQAYVLTLSAEFRKEIQRENWHRNQNMLNFSLGLYRAGQKSLIDISQASTQSTQAEVAFRSAQNQAQNSRVSLAQTLGVDVSVLEKRPLKPIFEEPYLPPNRATALQMLENNPTLLNLETVAKGLEFQAEMQRKSLLPVISTGVGYGLQGLEGPTATFWQFGLSLSVPLYQPGVESQARQFEAQAAQFRFDRDNAKTQLVQQLDTAFSDLHWTERRVKAAQLEVAQALANLELADKRYKGGLADYTEQINARSFVLLAQGDLLAALSDRKIAEGRLQQVLGLLPVEPGYDWEHPELPLPALPAKPPKGTERPDENSVRP